MLCFSTMFAMFEPSPKGVIKSSNVKCICLIIYLYELFGGGAAPILIIIIASPALSRKYQITIKWAAAHMREADGKRRESIKQLFFFSCCWNPSDDVPLDETVIIATKMQHLLLNSSRPSRSPSPWSHKNCINSIRMDTQKYFSSSSCCWFILRLNEYASCRKCNMMQFEMKEETL